MKRLLEEEGVISAVAFVTTTSDTSIEFIEESSHHLLCGQRKSEIIGNVEYRDVIILNDMIDSGSRVLNAAKICHENGAFRIFAFATHGLFTANAMQNIEDCKYLNEVFVCNTIYPPSNIVNKDILLLSQKFSYVSVGPIIAEAIRRIQSGSSLESMSYLKI